MSLANILFAIVMLHLLIGFGWAFYKLEFQKKNEKEKDKTGSEDKKDIS